MFEDTIKQVHAIGYRNGAVEEFDDPVVVEDTATLYFNGKKYISVVLTNDSLTEFGAGFCIAAGIAKSIDKVEVSGLDIYVEGEALSSGSGCLGSAGGYMQRPDEVAARTVADTASSIAPEEIFALREALNGDAWSQTGGLHCTALSYRHQVVGLFSDIARHNTVDKAIGYMVLQGYNPQECVLGCTGRQPVGMVQKAVNAGIPIIVSRAAATTGGIAVAEKCGVTLICFTRDRRFTVYTHPQRVILPQ